MLSPLFVLLAVLALLSPLGLQAAEQSNTAGNAASIEPYRASDCDRIVSTAPSLTEVIFDLELDSRLVGATEFCRYPPEALKVPRVGGYLDVSLERIIKVRPTVVFALKESAAALKPLERFNINLQFIDHSSLEGIRASYLKIAELCGNRSIAKMRLDALLESERLLKVRCEASRGISAPKRVMVAVGRTREGSADSGVYVSGHDGFYADIISLLGAVNVHTGRTVSVPSLSAEGISALAPDVVIDIVNVDDRGDQESFQSFWGRFANMPAVEQRRVVVLREDYASIPGPRYIVLAERLAQVICRADH